jgi:phosphatidylglycerophosphatase A
METGRRTAAEKLIVCVAEGFGAGRFPVAPGTVGTFVGFLWIYLLLLSGSGLVYFLGTVAGFFASVWLGGRAEKILGRKDPGSIVIDEITALPLAFGGALLVTGVVPFAQFLHGKRILVPLVAFAAFRLFDIAKPWIIGRSQALPGGWGLTGDDFLAALHVAPLTYLVALV